MRIIHYPKVKISKFQYSKEGKERGKKGRDGGKEKKHEEKGKEGEGCSLHD